MRRRGESVERVLRNSGAQIAELRKRLGMTQSELAERAGLHQNTVSNVERGARDSSVLALSLMQVHLGSPGVAVKKDGFVTLPPARPRSASCFSPNELSRPRMIGIMGARVRQSRQAIGLTQDGLAESSGVHPNTIWGFERGIVVPSISSVWKIYRALGVHLVIEEGGSIIFK